MYIYIYVYIHIEREGEILIYVYIYMYTDRLDAVDGPAEPSQVPKRLQMRQR